MTSTKPFEKLAFDPLLKIQPFDWVCTESQLSTETLDIARGFPVLCLFVTDRLNRDSIKKLSEFGVKLLALRSAGFNHIDVAAAKEFKIDVVRVPRYSPEAVAEFTVGLYLSLNRKIHRAHDRIREGNFSLQGLVGHNVKGKTIGVIGTGNIGKCVAQIFRGFDARVITCDIAPQEEWARKHQIEYCSLETLLKSSDVVSLHIPLTDKTKYLINGKSLALLKKGSYLINTSRGGLIETKALIQALKSQNLAGAALDVYEEEETIFFYDHSNEIVDDDVLMRLTTFPNVLITSHQAFLTQEALESIAMTTIESINAWSHGKPLINAL